MTDMFSYGGCNLTSVVKPRTEQIPTIKDYRIPSYVVAGYSCILALVLLLGLPNDAVKEAKGNNSDAGKTNSTEIVKT